jgi:hypothetical protein
VNDHSSITSRWRADAAVLRRYGCRRAAAVLERCADELDEELGRDVLVGLAEAEAITGYTRGHLRRLVREKTLANHGTDRAPQFRPGDLPRKPGYRRLDEITPSRGQPSIKDLVRAVVTGPDSADAVRG